MKKKRGQDSWQPKSQYYNDHKTAIPKLFPLPFNKQNLEGLGWKFLLLRKSWLDGLIIWRRRALIEFALATVDNSQLLEETGTTLARRRLDIPPGRLIEFRCWLHLNDPGCVVGEHRHVIRVCDFEFDNDDDDALFFEAMGIWGWCSKFQPRKQGICLIVN
ncbi:hypothetical protein COLO4_24141 [Corchorus olitorius]|uniref:Uncharacterized protein n=1 Tax=Corchorus olitorius TaxID=93759 RepID=A0A1R3ICN2_9ROSI|nr:hypothetical protein COLO4_24141 [Corchorus olitorius]